MALHEGDKMAIHKGANSLHMGGQGWHSFSKGGEGANAPPPLETNPDQLIALHCKIQPKGHPCSPHDY